jgi:hypothetical protein
MVGSLKAFGNKVSNIEIQNEGYVLLFQYRLRPFFPIKSSANGFIRLNHHQ